MTTISVLPGTKGILDALGRVCAGVIGAEDGYYVFASGETPDITALEETIVPLSDDFTELGMPAVTISLGPWKALARPMQERLHLTPWVVVWRNRVPLGDNVNALYEDRDLLSDAFIDHTKLWEQEKPADQRVVQSALVLGGPGIVPRSIPRGTGASDSGPRLFLTLPLQIEIVTNRVVTYQPA